MSTQTKISADLASKLLPFAIASGVYAQRTEAERIKQAQLQKLASDAAAPALDALLANGLIAPEQKQAAAAALNDHAQTLQLLKRAAEFYSAAKADKTTGLGAGEGTEKAASYDPMNTPFVGGRHNGRTTADEELFRGLGLS